MKEGGEWESGGGRGGKIERGRVGWCGEGGGGGENKGRDGKG